MIVKYPNAEDAKKAFNDFVELRKEWGEIHLSPPLEKGRLLIFEDSAHQFSTLCYHGIFVIATFLSKTKEDAEKVC